MGSGCILGTNMLCRRARIELAALFPLGICVHVSTENLWLPTGGNNQRRVAAKTFAAVKVSLMLKKVKTALRLGVCVFWPC